jgi:7-cyano-7-deazaguanine synthase
MMYQPKAVVLLSGGLDSATTTAIAKIDGYEVIALSFRYGQRHERELTAASRIAEILEISQHHIVDINLGSWGGSSLTDSSMTLPTDGIDPDIIPSTYVPGRNTVFIAIALSLAEAQKASSIYLGINAVDYSGYPDCRPEYLQTYQNLIALSSKVGIEGNSIQLIAPLIRNSKIDIVKQAIALGVPINETWSCYQGDSEPCGVCDSCRLRDEALIAAGYPELATPVGRKLHHLP